MPGKEPEIVGVYARTPITKYAFHSLALLDGKWYVAVHFRQDGAGFRKDELFLPLEIWNRMATPFTG